MCRFTAYVGPVVPLDVLVTHPDHSLIHQSYQCREREQPLNGDGFGVGWYVPGLSPEPAVFREITPAWSNQNLLHLARVTQSGCCFAHVRAASPGLAVTQTNCHPFAWGPLLFMHNGQILPFRRVQRAILERLSDEAFHAIRGTTDSEHLFALFIDRWRGLEREAPSADERLRRALKATVDEAIALARMHGVEAPCQLNLAVTDGRTLCASRVTSGAPEGANSLYVHQGKCYAKGPDGRPVMGEPGPDGPAVIISSERLGQDPGWARVPPNHLVVVADDRTVRLEPVAVEAAGQAE